MLPWDNEPAKNISPFFLFADHGELMRERTREVVAKAKAHDVVAEMAELNHTPGLSEMPTIKLQPSLTGYLSSTTNGIRSNHCSCNSSRSVAIV